MSLAVTFEETPNPNSLKFNISQTIAEEQIQFEDPMKAQRSPLATKIFGFPWASGVFIGPNFVTVSKQDWVEWSILAEPLANLIKEHIESKEIVLLPASEINDLDSNDSDDVKLIKQILHDEIRPFVAMDGGSIEFHKYENNVLYVSLHGACSGCPSSTMTLKNGIETRIKESLPHLAEVVSIN